MAREAGAGEPVYLELVDALELYAAVIGATPEQAFDQLRDPGALEGALGRPPTYAHYADADLALQAAVLAHGVAEAQAFIDANKRLALVSMLTFLELNGFLLEASDPELAEWILFAAGTTPEQLAPFLREAMRPIR